MGKAPLSLRQRWDIVTLSIKKDPSRKNKAMSDKSIAKRLSVSRQVVSKYRNTYYNTGNVLLPSEKNTGGRGGGRYPRMPDAHLDVLYDLIHATPYLQLTQCAVALADKGMYARDTTRYSDSCICRALGRLGLSRKKLKYISHRIDPAEQKRFDEARQLFSAEQCVFLDETMKNPKELRPTVGRAPPGKTPVVFTQAGAGSPRSQLALCCVTGFLAWDDIAGGYDGDTFLEVFKTRFLIKLKPYPQPCSVLFLDNCRYMRFDSFHRSAPWPISTPAIPPSRALARHTPHIHTFAHNRLFLHSHPCSIHHKYRDRLEQMVNRRGARIVWLPPYSPWFNPIEEFFKDLKADYKKYRLWVNEDVDRAIAYFMRRSVSMGAAIRHYAHCGYHLSAPAAAALAPLARKDAPSYIYN
jgi:transposase